MQRVKLILITIALAVCFASCQNMKEEKVSLETVEEQDGEEATGTDDSIFVHVCGAVQCEGVYELPAGSRVYEAIEKAGGFREDAAMSEVNQAELLEDAARIYIPTVTEMLNSQSQSDGKVNINKASKEELMSLPGVGESRAESIIQYREEQGSFKSIEDIMQISGIKEGLFQKIKDLIKV